MWVVGECTNGVILQGVILPTLAHRMSFPAPTQPGATCEGGNRLQQQLSRLLELPDRRQKHSLVHLRRQGWAGSEAGVYGQAAKQGRAHTVAGLSSAAWRPCWARIPGRLVRLDTGSDHSHAFIHATGHLGGTALAARSASPPS